MKQSITKKQWDELSLEQKKIFNNEPPTFLDIIKYLGSSFEEFGLYPCSSPAEYYIICNDKTYTAFHEPIDVAFKAFKDIS